MNNKISIGIDIHGCLDTITDTLRPIMELLVSNGHDVHIITGVPFNYVLVDLVNMGILWGEHYTHFFSIEQEMERTKQKVVRVNTKGRNEYASDLWNVAKANYCYKNKISLMIDDSETYEQYFVTPFARLRKYK
jgi:hypothetical protein